MKIFLIGMMGAGKTTLGNQLAKHIAYQFVDLDNLIEKRESKTIAELFEKHGEEYFREVERKALESVAELHHVVISAGGGTPCYFDNMKWMNQQGLTVFVSLPIQEIQVRLKQSKAERPLIAELSEIETIDRLKKLLNERKVHYMKAKYVFEPEKKESISDVERLVELIGEI